MRVHGMLMVLVWAGMSTVAWAKPAKVVRVEPAETPVYEVPRIHVSDFEGPGGELMAQRIRDELVSTDHGVKRGRIDKLDEGLRVNPHELLDAPDDADAVLGGENVFAETYSDGTGKVEKKNEKGEVVKDSDGKAIMIEVPCRKLAVDVTTRWQLTASDGSVLRSGEEGRKLTQEECGEGLEERLSTPEALAAEAVRTGGDLFVQAIKLAKPKLKPAKAIVKPMMPHWKVHKLDLKKNKQNKLVAKFAEGGDFDQAICEWQDADDPQTVYNLGALYELKGWYELAEDAYERAADADPKAKYAKEGVLRVRSRADDVDEMREGYGLPDASEPALGELCS